MQGDKDGACHLSSVPHVFSGSALLCDISLEQRFLGPYKKSVNHWWDLKAFLDLIVFRAGAHDSSFLHTDISGRPRGHTWPRCSFLDSHAFSHAPSSFHFSAFPPHCALLWSSYLFNLSIIQDAFFDPWGHEKPIPPLLRMPPAFVLYFYHVCFWRSL